MAAVQRDVEIDVGNTYVLNFQWRTKSHLDSDGNTVLGPPKDLTDWRARFILRDSVTEPTIYVAKSYGTDDFPGDATGVTIGQDPAPGAGDPDPTNGWITCVMPDNKTALLTAATRYVVEAQAPNGQSFRILEGKVKLAKGPDLGLDVSWTS